MSLDNFVVGKRECSQLGELRNLDLHVSLRIKHLERVKNDMDAKEANLFAKENLFSLHMIWNGPNEGLNDIVLEALAPHPNLKVLEISGFRGFRLPDWMSGSVLKNVVKIEIIDCLTNCVSLPFFGELQCLEYLLLKGSHTNVEYVEDNVDDCGSFPSLRELHIRGFPNLKGLMKKEGKEQFPILERIYVWYCPVLIFPTLACVNKLEVTDAATLSSMSYLCTLTSLAISNHDGTSLPEDFFKILAYLEELQIARFQNLKELPYKLGESQRFEVSAHFRLPSATISPSWHFGNEKPAGVANYEMSRIGKEL